MKVRVGTTAAELIDAVTGIVPLADLYSVQHQGRLTFEISVNTGHVVATLTSAYGCA